MRAFACVLAIAVLLVTELAPHHHDDWMGSAVEGLSAQDVHNINCRIPRSKAHFDADAVRHIEPCVACLRQHLQAIRAAHLDRVPLAIVSHINSFVALVHIATINLSKSSRAPPAALL